MATVALLPAHQQFRRRLSGPIATTIRRPNHIDIDQSYRKALKQETLGRSVRITKTQVNRTSRQRRPRFSYSGWGEDDEDGRRLAADPSVALPSDRRPSMPRLERQEAFREPKTITGFYSDVVEDDSDLYKLGLLYDDEYTRGSYFNLDTIVHSEPVYSVRPGKRARKQRQEPSDLYLDLSFALLDQDVDFEQFLAPQTVEIPAPVEDISTSKENYRDGNLRVRSYKDVALSAIPELPEGSSPIFESPALAAPYPPALVSGSEREDEEDPYEWAVLRDADVLSNADADADVEDAVDATSGTGEAWVVLGDGS